MLPAHLMLLLVDILCRRNRHSCDRHFLRNDRIDAPRKTELNRPSDLATVHFSSHDGSEGPHVVEVLAHERNHFLGVLGVLWESFLLSIRFHAKVTICLHVLLIEDSTFLDIYAVAVHASLHDLDVVPYLTF